MGSKENKENSASNHKSAKKQVPEPKQAQYRDAVQQTALGSIIQRAQQDPRSLTPSDVLRLQQTAGNRVAKANGFELIGTDLSALEEGTPEFYQSIGLVADPNEAGKELIAAMSGEAMKADSDEEREAIIKGMERMLWAGRLNGKVSTVLGRTKAKVESGHWSLVK